MIRLALAGVRFHWRPYLSVAFGVAVATAVLVGSLGVGDALRDALAENTRSRLGPVDTVVHGEQSFPASLSSRLAETLGDPPAPVYVVDAVLKGELPVAGLTLWGVDEDLWRLAGGPDQTPPPGEVVLSASAAAAASVSVGDTVVVRFSGSDGLPRDSAWTGEDGGTVGSRLVVAGILEARWPSELAFQVDSRSPRNAFVQRRWLAERLGPGDHANMLLLAGADEAAFRAVDQDLVLDTARAARELGVERFVHISSVGADPMVKPFYLRVKGEVERELTKLRFNRLDILRPGLLRGTRDNDRRPAERLGIAAAPVANLLLHGKYRQYRGIKADVVARAALALAKRAARGRFVHDNDAIQRAAHTLPQIEHEVL